MRIMTHSGQNVTVYCLNGEPIFFEIEKRVIPTGTTLNEHSVYFITNEKKKKIKCMVTFKDFTHIQQ